MSTDRAPQPLQQWRSSYAFVVQLSGESGPNGLRGRIQHLSSMQTSHFESLQELAGIMLQILGQADSGSGKG